MPKTKNESAEMIAFRDVVQLLLDSSLLLAFEEKAEFSSLLPMLSMPEMTELFNLLVGAQRDTENILKKLVNDFPDVVKQLDRYQVKILKQLFKGRREMLQQVINPEVPAMPEISGI